MENIKIIKPSAITLGNFDGFHKGHMKLINKTNDYAKKNNLLSLIFTTTPAASKFFGNEKKKILESKSFFVKKYNLCDVFIRYPFDDNFAKTLPLDFLFMIKNKFNAKAIIIGENYRFGKEAKGDISLIKEFANEHGIHLEVISLEQENGEKISSTIIRKFISDGDIEKANSFLDYAFFKTGIVTKTDGRGAEIGFPTANLNLNNEALYPKFGVYITKTTLLGKTFNSVTNIGPKPTFDVLSPQIETHILDEKFEDLYGNFIEVSFYKKIRETIKFNSIEEIKKQINLDIEIAKDYFKQEKIINANTKI